MRHLITTSFIAGGLALAAGCMAPPPKSPAEPAACPGLAEIDQPERAIVIVLDTSRELGKEFGRIKDDIKQLMLRLPPQSVLFVQTSGPEGGVLSDGVPSAPGAFACDLLDENPFDVVAQQTCRQRRSVFEAQLGCVETARLRMTDKLDKLEVPPATQSDLTVTLVATAGVFQSYPTARARSLILYTQGESAQAAAAAKLTGFEGVGVIFRGPSRPNIKFSGAMVTAAPLVVPLSSLVFRREDAQPPAVAAASPLPAVTGSHQVAPASDLAAFMDGLEPGPYTVCVVTHTSHESAKTEVQRIYAAHPELRPSVFVDGRHYGVRLGHGFYAQQSAEALRAKAVSLGARPDTFVFRFNTGRLNSLTSLPEPAGR